MAAGALLVVSAVTSDLALADTAPAPGTPATVSADGLPTWQVNGVVWSQAVVGNTVYATGSFTKARPPGVAAGGVGEVGALNVFAYDITTGNRVAFSHSLNAQGLAVTASPDGSRIYIGGDFTSVDGLARGHVAAFDTATGALLTSFAPNVSNEVRVLAATSSTVFIGGGYGAVNGVTRTSLSAVSTTGSLLPWAPRATGGNGDVWSMVVTPDQSRVVVGGSFTSLNGVAASGMGSLDATTGSIQRWDANQTIRNGGTASAIASLRTDGQQIYGSGYAFGTGNFEGTFAANPTTGAITLVNDCHGDTYDVLPVGPILYSVSHSHDCSWIRSFPDTNPRVRWEHALAETIAPATTNKGPDNYGWNYNGLPASTVLHWFPQLSAGTYTGQGQAAWSLAGNTSYVVLGGEFPAVNDVAQQGLVRMAISSLAPDKQGPTYTTQPATPVPATTATSPSAGTVSITFGTAWDFDNETLTYDLFRDGASTGWKKAVKSNFWTLPNATMTDTTVPEGAHVYQVRISDPSGNTLWSPQSNSVTVIGGTNVAPTASFTTTVNGLSVAVNGAGSTDTDGTIASYAWTFGDGGTATGTTASHTYAVDGTYAITLTVTDNGGATGSTTRSVTIPPVVVTATAPSKRDGCGTTGDAYVVPSMTGVEYLVGGVVKAPGSYAASGTVTITARAKSGYQLTGTTSWSLTFDSAGCAATLTAAATATPTYTSAKITPSWGVTGTSYGTKTYYVQRRTVTVSSGVRVYSAVTTLLSGTTATSATFTGANGAVYQFRAMAKDGTGSFSSWSPWRTVAMPTDSTATSLTYGGTWGTYASTAAYGGSYRSTRAAKAYVSTTAYTDQVIVIGTKATVTGKISVYVDGTLKATVDTYRSTAAARQTLATVIVPYGRHTIKVVNLATSGRPGFYFDAIALRR